ncbi:MAG: hypothetical protein DRJ42_08250, partial [Deltaproteobacteria bacterium]
MRLFASVDDGLRVEAGDELFSLKLGALLLFRYGASSTVIDSRRSTFEVPVARPHLRGYVLAPWIEFFVQPELAGPRPRLLDLVLRIQPIPEIGLQGGQFPTPFTRAYLTPVPKLLFPGFSVANTAFRAGRDTGIEMFGKFFEGLVEYRVGIFNGNHIGQGGNDDDLLLYMGRLMFNPFGWVAYDETPGLAGPQPFQLSVGINGYVGESQQTEMMVDPATGLPAPAAIGTQHRNVAGLDLAMRWGLVTLQAEGY